MSIHGRDNVHSLWNYSSPEVKNRQIGGWVCWIAEVCIFHAGFAENYVSDDKVPSKVAFGSVIEITELLCAAAKAAADLAFGSNMHMNGLIKPFILATAAVHDNPVVHVEIAALDMGGT